MVISLVLLCPGLRLLGFAFRTGFNQFSGQWCLFGGLACCGFVWSTTAPGVPKCQQELALEHPFTAVGCPRGVNANVSHLKDRRHWFELRVALLLILGWTPRRLRSAFCSNVSQSMIALSGLLIS